MNAPREEDASRVYVFPFLQAEQCHALVNGARQSKRMGPGNYCWIAGRGLNRS